MTPVEVLTATSPPGDGLGATSTYRDQEIGFELDYPAEWYIEDVSAEIREQSSSYAVVLTSWEPDLGGVGGIPAGATKVDVIVIKSGTTTLPEAVAQLRQQWEAGDPPVTILSEEKWALAGDLQAVRWQVESLGEQSAAVITVIHGNTVILSGLGDSDLFDAVACTMRPALPSTSTPIPTALATQSAEPTESVPCPLPQVKPPSESRFDPLDGAGAIAYSNNGLWLVYPATGRTVQLHQGLDTAFVWSPDGNRITFLSRLRSEPCAFAFLMLADLRTGTIRPLLDRPGLYSRPAWSPDGRYLAYTESNGRLQVLRLSDNQVRVLSDDAYMSKVIDLRGDTVDVLPQAPKWVDGMHIAYLKSDEFGGVLGLAEVSLDGSESAMLVTDTVCPYDGFTLAPDGSRLAYARSEESPLLVIDLRSDERVAVEENSSKSVRSPSERLQWSPDGVYLVGRAGPVGIFLMEGDPPAYRVSQLKAFGVLGEAQSWAPDSRRFVILVEEGNNQLPSLAIYDLEQVTLSELAVELRPPYTVAWNPK